ncbi:MAG: AbrB/MazE/SpoVT family DNA-binding domain-containing protein [Candidatus Syntrophonatronum acetioxidans]|uniref:AbrB/MazE/SpoVT family DNA-binding domain-containing protein n=1 Tax=Candidatus Syntrophonatronum acetioxidans TaxID=1795816 RepID=A0A424YD00_9FIRM|nr:MAG: AbrB/MazE/SpoVT family DNA-binding domain-containing protein [Candidatus Syntrophonatronum acetioxidans]
MPATPKERDRMERKIINVSKKRQITIPLKFYNKLGLENEVECSLENGAIVIRPVYRDNSEFSVEILKDLVYQGYSGDELIKKFKEQNKNIKSAVGKILEEADEITSGKKKSATFEDIFETED